VSRARLLLHLAALLAPLAAAFGFSMLLPHDDAALVIRQTLLFGGVGALAAEIAAFACWRALDRRAKAGAGAWVVGLGMAALAHLGFGVIAVLALLAAAGWEGSVGERGVVALVIQVVFFVAASTFGVGFVTFPATAAIAQAVASLRRKELAHGG
jgi:hypothetical protein